MGFFLLSPNVGEENGSTAKPQMALEPKTMLNVRFRLARAVRARHGAFCSLLFLLLHVSAVLVLSWGSTAGPEPGLGSLSAPGGNFEGWEGEREL